MRLSWGAAVLAAYAPSYRGTPKTRETDADSGNTYFAYDALGRMTTITNPFAEEFGFVYDDANRLTAKELASGAVTYQSYDDAGRVSQVLTAKSDDAVLASYDYVRDARGNPTRITAADGVLEGPHGRGPRSGKGSIRPVGRGSRRAQR